MTTLNPYPSPSDDKNKTLKASLDIISRERKNDVNLWNNLPQVFMSGRLVGNIPASTSDISTNKIGDFIVTTSYVYFCVAATTTAQWVRAAVGAF